MMIPTETHEQWCHHQSSNILLTETKLTPNCLCQLPCKQLDYCEHLYPGEGLGATTKANMKHTQKQKLILACLHQHSLKQVDWPHQLSLQSVNCRVFLTVKIMPTAESPAANKTTNKKFKPPAKSPSQQQHQQIHKQIIMLPLPHQQWFHHQSSYNNTSRNKTALPHHH